MPTTHARRLTSLIGVVAVVSLVTGCTLPWLPFGGGPSHSGFNSSDHILTIADLGPGTTFHQDWQVSLPATADGAPVITSITSAGTVIDLVIVTTKTGSLQARDLDTGAVRWTTSFPAGTCKINHGSDTCYTTSSPVIVGASVYTYGLDGKVHKIAVATGTETQSGGWPVTTTLKPWDEKGSSALSSATGADGHTYLYAVHAGYPGDRGDYQGHLVAIDLANAHAKVFNTLCSNQTVLFAPAPAAPDCPEVTSGVWARAGTMYDPTTDRIFITTGNATFSPAGHHWGDTVLAIRPDGSGTGGNPIDTYTPANFQQLQDFDQDLGSTVPVLAPAPAGSTVTDLGVQGGKDQRLYLLNMADLSGQHGPGHTGGEIQTVPVPQGGLVFSSPAVWTNPADGRIWVFVGTGSGLAGLTIDLGVGNRPQLTPRWQNTANAATSPLVDNGVLFAMGGTSIGAFNPTTGTRIWTTTTGGTHWQSPVITSGRLVFEDNAGHLSSWIL